MEPEQPSYTYDVFIDEAGDSGLEKVRPLDPVGSSEWLVLGAVIVRRERYNALVDAHASLRDRFKIRQRPDIHFADLSEWKRLHAAEELAGLPIRVVGLMSNKKNMRKYRNDRAATMWSQDFFYNWCMRLLLERVTRVAVADASRKRISPLCKLTLSRRGGFSYGQMRAYLDYMKIRGNRLYRTAGSISWPALDRRLVDVVRHSENVGLQFADIATSALYSAVNTIGPGVWDTRPARALAPVMARRDGLVRGTGVVLQPMPTARAKLSQQQRELFEFHGYTFT